MASGVIFGDKGSVFPLFCRHGELLFGEGDMRSNGWRAFAGATFIVVLGVAATPATALTQQQIDQCVNRDGTSPEQWISACTAAIQSGRWSGNGLAWAYNNRGNAYQAKGNYDQAIADYNQAIQLDPKDALAYYSRGIAYDDKGNYDQAIADYTQAIKLDPKYAVAYYNRGNAYQAKGNYDQAIADYTQAIKLDPK